MPKHKKDNNHSPSYYIRKRLAKNVPALFGLGVIILAHIIAILGYLIMPDDAPKVDSTYYVGQPQAPGWSCTYIKELRPIDTKKVGWFQRMLFGQEPNYILTAIKSYEIDEEAMKVSYVRYYDTTRTVKAYKKRPVEKDIIKLTRRVMFGYSDKLGQVTYDQFIVSGKEIKYLDIDEKVQVVSKDKILKEFKDEFIVTKNFVLGTDGSGRDVLSRLIFGTRISLSVGGIAVLISLVIGILLGALAGFFGGWVDAIIMWFMTVIWSIPPIILVIAIALALGHKGVWTAFVAVGLTMWVDVARIVRGQILAIREKLYVESARALGIGNFRIIFRHILPNIMGPLIVIAASNFAAAVLMEAGLSYLNLGVEAPKPSWGRMVFEGGNKILGPNLADHWHLLVYPGICISLLVLAFNLLGNGLRDAYDPKSMLK